jgi:hypothetical protein
LETEEFHPPVDDYYLFPIKPGVRNTLAGTMGELRSTHFHTGIDIRTGGTQGVPVQAAAGGYISRISVSPTGYGNALYVTHNNGQTTVYAHLLSFADDIEKYTAKKQHEKQSFSVNLFPPKDALIVEKGEIIALSGNTGSSGGPHLHFDIRDDQPAVLNPLSFHFEEIVDTRPPEVRQIAIKTVGIDSRVNDQFGRFVFNAVKEGNNYTIDTPLQIEGVVGIELYAFDRQDWTRFRTGINEITFTLDDQLIFEQDIEVIPFSKSRNFYNHINYKELRKNGRRFQKLYVDNGNTLEFYSTNASKGLFMIEDADDHTIRIQMKDTYGNSSSMIIPLVGNNSNEELPAWVPGDCGHTIIDNTLAVYANEDTVEYAAQFHFGDRREYIMPSYMAGGRNVYLWNLLDGIPDSVSMLGTIERIPQNAMIPSNQSYTYYSPFLEAKFSSKSLFDTVYVNIDYQQDTINKLEIFQFGNYEYPVRNSITVKLTPQETYDKERTHVYTYNKPGSYGFAGGEWEGESIRFKTRNFAEYTLVTDTIPPRIKPLIVNSEKLVFRIEDRLSGIRSFKVYVNDDWVLMNYDPKKKQIWTAKVDPAKVYRGELRVELTDNSGNERIYTSTIR